MAGGRSFADIIGMRDDQLINKACSFAMKDHKPPEKPYILEKPRGSPETNFFIFPGSWWLSDWVVAQKPFGETKINRPGNPPKFPSLRSIGNDEVATVNEAFLRRFQDKILGGSDFKEKVQKAATDKKQIVFTGHSLGGSMAILATLWFLDNRKSDKSIPPLCVTFGCPLTGDHIFSHALRREKWAPYFMHFVMRYDIVPRLLLAPIPSIEKEFGSILRSFTTKSVDIPEEAPDFYRTVMTNAASVASHAACKLMANPNLLLETVTNFTALSPYKPFGTYVLCTGNGKLVVLTNPDAVLQLLFYSAQLSSETELHEIARTSLLQHFGYENELKKSLEKAEKQYVVNLNTLETLSYSAEATGGDSATINSALNDLGLSTRARLCLLAAIEFEKRKQRNKDYIDAKKNDIHKEINELESYRDNCKLRQITCYDAFRLHNNRQDFRANVNRLELASIWDEIIEMVKRYQLPDDFEGQEDWVELGTRYRRLVEPLDVANYYRHSKDEESGPYLGTPGKHRKPRPKRYIYPQRWREHAKKLDAESSGESHFWAEVEELRKTSSIEGFEIVKPRVLQLEKNIQKWVKGGELGMDVLSEESILRKWWKTLPDQHKKVSCIQELIDEEKKI